MATLPTPHSDANSWGEEMNEFLRVVHAEDGTLKQAELDAALAGSPYLTAALSGSSGDSTAPLTAPRHPVAVQGPTDPANLYAIVTWDRADPQTTGWRVYRDDVLVDEIADAGGADDWDKRFYRDRTVVGLSTYSYRIAPMWGPYEGPLSQPATIAIRRNHPDKVFDVTAQVGATTRLKLVAAEAAANASAPTYLEPAVILFPAGTHTLATADSAGGTVASGHNNIVVRGAGMASTIVRAGYSGGASSETGPDNVLIKFGGSTTSLGGVLPSSPVARNTYAVTLNDASSFAVGDIITLNEIAKNNTSADDNEDYDAWDCNEILAKDGNTLTVKFPWAKPFTTAALVGKLQLTGCGIEQMTVEGQASDETTYYTLIEAQHVSKWHMAEVRGRWCNRNVLYLRGWRPNVVSNRITQTDPRTLAGEISRYDLTVGRGSGMVLVDNEIGDLDRVGSSMVTTQVHHRQIVRHNRFYRSENYGWNEHGSAAPFNIFENNYVYMPEATKGGVFLGNSSFYYAQNDIVRGNLFHNCDTAAIACQQNSYGLRILDNWFRDCPDDLVNWYGSDFADMSAGTYGDARLTIRRNRCDYTTAAKTNRGFVVGYSGGSDPYPGVHNVVIADNEIDVDADAIKMEGTAAQTFGFQVSGNTGMNDYTRPTLVAGDYWQGNADSQPVVGNGSEGSPYFADTFSGTAGASAGWPIYLRNTATGTGADFLVSSSGNYGRLSLFSTPAGTRKIECALRSDRCHDSFAMADFRDATDALSRIQALVARHAGVNANDDHYRVVYEYAGASPRLRIEKVIAGVATTLASTAAFDADLIGDLRVKLEVLGGTPATIRARAWLISGGEPGTWTLTASDSSIPEPGKCGLLLDGPDSQTTSADFDNYKLISWLRNATPAYGSFVEPAWTTEVFPWEIDDMET